MKITKRQLRQIIKEEWQRLNEWTQYPQSNQRHIEDLAREYYDIYGDDVFRPDFLDNTWGRGLDPALIGNRRDGKKYMMSREDLLSALERYRR